MPTPFEKIKPVLDFLSGKTKEELIKEAEASNVKGTIGNCFKCALAQLIKKKFRLAVAVKLHKNRLTPVSMFLDNVDEFLHYSSFRGVYEFVMSFDSARLPKITTAVSFNEYKHLQNTPVKDMYGCPV